MASVYDQKLCPLCGKIPEYNHLDGVSICKCSNKECRGSKSWMYMYEWEMFQIENRIAGYYWVKVYSCADWSVARWDGVNWHVPGKEIGIDPSKIDERQLKRT